MVLLNMLQNDKNELSVGIQLEGTETYVCTYMMLKHVFVLILSPPFFYVGRGNCLRKNSLQQKNATCISPTEFSLLYNDLTIPLLAQESKHYLVI